MKTVIFVIGVVLGSLVATGGCKWTDFDDLANTTWVHSTQSPNVGSTDYAIALAGTTADATGGRLSVVGNDTPTYSTLIYDAKGNVSLGPNPERLASHSIASFGVQPLFVVSGTTFAIVAPSTSANFIAVHVGAADAPSDTSIASGLPPDAAAFLGTTLVVAAGPNLYLLDSTGTRWCAATDDAAAPLAVSALGADDVNVWAWTTAGKLISYPKASLTACAMTGPTTTAGTPVTPNMGAFAAGFAPGTGAVVQILGSSTTAKEYVVLAGHDQGTTGQVISVDAATLMKADGFAADGIASAVVGDLGAATTYVVAGFPSRAVGSTTTGQVELHTIDATTGKLGAASAETLNDDQPDSNEEFGRAVGIVKFNGTNVLAVAAKNEVFTYFRTQSYPETRQQ